jgi:hypothetical protein
MKPLVRATLTAAVMAVLGLPACDSVDAVVNPPPPQVSIRFVNAIVDAQGNILLKADNVPVGTPLAFGAAAALCTVIDTGTTNLAFGVANSFGTNIATSLGTLTHDFSAAGDFTVIATGSAASPQLLIFNDEPVAEPTAGNAAVRFVNAVPGTAALDVFATAPFAIRTTPVATNLTFGTTTNAFVNVPVGSTQLTFTRAGTTDDVVFAAPTLLTLTAGDVRTVVLAPMTTGMTEFQAITVQRC